MGKTKETKRQQISARKFNQLKEDHKKFGGEVEIDEAYFGAKGVKRKKRQRR